MLAPRSSVFAPPRFARKLATNHYFMRFHPVLLYYIYFLLPFLNELRYEICSQERPKEVILQLKSGEFSYYVG